MAAGCCWLLAAGVLAAAGLAAAGCWLLERNLVSLGSAQGQISKSRFFNFFNFLLDIKMRGFQ